MRNVERTLAFVLAASNHGTMIVNRFDHRKVDAERSIGVGYQVLQSAAYDANEVSLVLQLLDLRRQFHGDGVVAIDCGANIGVHAVEWAIAMTGWGSVIAIEAQERIYYALAGNIAINNCFNATALHAAVAAETGILRIPTLDHLTPSSFGSLELRPSARNEPIGQAVDYSEAKLVPVQTIALDALKLARVDLIKIDIEGMEIEALHGARELLAAQRPVVLVEAIKTDTMALANLLTEHGYRVLQAGMNLLAIHADDETLTRVTVGAPPSSSAS